MQACACCVCLAALCQALLLVGYRTHEGAEQLPSQHLSLSFSPPPAPAAAAPSPPTRTSVSSSAASPSSPLRVPRLIHQSWRDGGFPKSLFNWRWQQGLVDLNPGWKLIKWTDESSRALIANEYAWFLPTYDGYPSYIQRSDAARYFIVYHHGGVYADLDIECSRPFEPVLANHRAVFSYKQASNMSRGLVNALFASEARHPLWTTVFDMLSNRSTVGAAAATHVDVVRSTGPGLLREALLQLRARGAAEDGGDALVRMGIHLMDSSVWHPILAEQKRGRDPSAAAAIADSHCYHHFVSSWMTHDKEKHVATETSRERQLGGNVLRTHRRASQGAATTVPTGQSIRTSNPWKSFDVVTKGASDAAALGASRDSDAAAASDASEMARMSRLKSFVHQAAAKRKARRRRAGG